MDGLSSPYRFKVSRTIGEQRDARILIRPPEDQEADHARSGSDGTCTDPHRGAKDNVRSPRSLEGLAPVEDRSAFGHAPLATSRRAERYSGREGDARPRALAFYSRGRLRRGLQGPRPTPERANPRRRDRPGTTTGSTRSLSRPEHLCSSSRRCRSWLRRGSKPCLEFDGTMCVTRLNV